MSLHSRKPRSRSSSPSSTRVRRVRCQYSRSKASRSGTSSNGVEETSCTHRGLQRRSSEESHRGRHVRKDQSGYTWELGPIAHRVRVNVRVISCSSFSSADAASRLSRPDFDRGLPERYTLYVRLPRTGEWSTSGHGIPCEDTMLGAARRGGKGREASVACGPRIAFTIIVNDHLHRKTRRIGPAGMISEKAENCAM